MMKKLIIGFAIFILSITTFSKEDAPKIIVLKQNALNGLTKDESVILRKSSLEAILLAKKFELSLADIKGAELGKDKIWYQFQVEIAKTSSSDWDMKYELVEMPSGNIVNRIIEKRVLTQQLQYRGRINSLKLIFGKYVNEEKGTLEKNIVIPLDQYIEINKPKLDEESKKIEIPPEAPVSVELNLEQDKYKALADSANQEEDKKEKAEENKAKNEKKIFPKNNLNNQVTISNFSSPNVDLAKEPYKPEEIKISNFIKSFSYGIGIEKETIDSNLVFTSNETVNTEINLSRLMLRLSMNSSDDVNGNYIKYLLGISQTVGDNKYGVGPKLNIGSSYHYELLEKRLRFGAIAELERNGYANLKTRGEGIQPITSTILYGGVSSKVLFEFKNYPSEIGVAFKRSFWGSSDISSNGDAAIIDGSKVEINLKSAFYGMWGINVLAEIGAVNSAVNTKLDNKHNMMALYVVYN